MALWQKKHQKKKKRYFIDSFHVQSQQNNIGSSALGEIKTKQNYNKEQKQIPFIKT